MTGDIAVAFLLVRKRDGKPDIEPLGLGSAPVRRLTNVEYLNSLRDQLSPRTRLVAVGLAGNATGTINPVADISPLAHSVNALLYVDAVHFAPHGRINVEQLGCDFLVCSAYKFFGPHVGVFWGCI